MYGRRARKLSLKAPDNGISRTFKRKNSVVREEIPEKILRAAKRLSSKCYEIRFLEIFSSPKIFPEIFPQKILLKKIPRKMSGNSRKNSPEIPPEKNPKNKFPKTGGNFRGNRCRFLPKNAVVL